MTQRGYRVDDLIIDLSRRRVLRGDDEIQLPPLSFDLLLALAREAPNVLSFDDLMSKVWTGLVVSPEAVTQRIKLVRNALGDDPQTPRYIQSVRGRGYRMLAPVAPLPEPVLDQHDVVGRQVSELAKPNTATRPGGLRKRVAVAAILVLATGVALVAMIAIWERLQQQPIASEAVIDVPARTVAVLPFTNLSGDPGYEYFSDGLTEELINRFTTVPGLHVVARTSSFHYKGKSEKVQAIGEALGVRHLLEGSVRKSGQTLRVTAQLVDTESGYHVWSDTIERPLHDILTIQDEIALAVVEGLEITLRDEERAALVYHPTRNPEALDLYLRARHFYQSFHLERMDKAIGYYEAALQLDPAFAAAYVGLADAMYNRLQIAEMRPYDENLSPIVSLLRKAIALDPRLGDAHAILSHVLMSQYDFEGAAREQRLAEAISPNGAYVLFSSAQFYGFVGWPAEKGIEYARKGRRLDPLNSWAAAQVPIALLHAQQYDAALSEMDNVIELDPDFWIAHWVRAVILDALARYDEALTSAERAVALNDYSDTQTNLAIAYARVGRTQEARAIFDRLADPRPGKYWPPTLRAMVLLALGDRDGALTALERARDERDQWLPPMLHYRPLLPLHDEPRFQRLVKYFNQDKRVNDAVLAYRAASRRKAL